MKRGLLLQLLLISTCVFSQDKTDSLKFWKTGGVGTLNLSQVALSNWAQGGENSFSATALFNLFSNYKKGNSSWENALDVTYGFLQSGSARPRKSDDKIEFTSKYGYKTSNHWSLANMISFKSQLTEGYNYPNDTVAISNLMAPGYITISTGMDYKPKDDFSFFMSPVTGKITIVNDQKLADAGAYGVQKAEYDSTGYMLSPGEMVRYEFGALLSFKIKQVIATNITLSSKLDLFSNYLSNPQNVDANWDVLINMKVNKFVSASINTTLIYDHDIPVPVYASINGVKTQTGTGPRTQFKEVFAVGLSYKF